MAFGGLCSPSSAAVFVSKPMKNGTDCNLNNLNCTKNVNVVIDHDLNVRTPMRKYKTKTKKKNYLKTFRQTTFCAAVGVAVEMVARLALFFSARCFRQSFLHTRTRTHTISIICFLTCLRNAHEN